MSLSFRLCISGDETVSAVLGRWRPRVGRPCKRVYSMREVGSNMQ